MALFVSAKASADGTINNDRSSEKKLINLPSINSNENSQQFL